MAADILDASYFLHRVGEPDERPKDRAFAAKLGTMVLRYRFRLAREAGDYERMDDLEREFRYIECL